MGKTKVFYPRYNKPTLGGIIDEHILLRIRGLQDTEKLEHLDVTCNAVKPNKLIFRKYLTNAR